MKNALFLAISILFIIGGFYFLISSPKKETPKFVFEPTRAASQTTPSTENGKAAAVTGTLNSNKQKEFRISNNIFAFAPQAITVNKGDKVKIIFKNTGGTHDLRIDGYNIGTKVTQNGKESEFEFTADKTGTFEFYCSVGNHRAMGMKGTLTVK